MLFVNVHVNIHVVINVCIIILIYVILMINACVVVLMFMLNCYSLTYSFIGIYRKIATKKKARNKPDLLSYFVFWYELVNVCVHVSCIHA